MRWAFKLVGAILLVLVGTLIGWQKAAAVRKRAEALQQLGRLIVRIQEEIEYRATPLSELLLRVQADSAFACLQLADCTSLRSFSPPAYIHSAQWQQLRPFFERLGQTSGDECVQQSAYYQALCAEWYETAKEDACTANRLYTKMGLCCGTLAALMLL